MFFENVLENHWIFGRCELQFGRYELAMPTKMVGILKFISASLHLTEILEKLRHFPTNLNSALKFGSKAKWNILVTYIWKEYDRN